MAQQEEQLELQLMGTQIAKRFFCTHQIAKTLISFLIEMCSKSLALKTELEQQGMNYNRILQVRLPQNSKGLDINNLVHTSDKIYASNRSEFLN